MMSESIDKFVITWNLLGELGLTDTIFNHLSMSDDGQDMVINTGGMLARQLSKENVCRVSISDPDDGNLKKINQDGLRLHSQIHRTRNCPGVIVHTHSVHAVAVSACVEGLLPISQTAMEFYDEIVTIKYDGLFRSGLLSPELLKLATTGGIGLLQNHGVLVVANTLEEAFYLTYYFEEAAKIQCHALSMGLNLVTPSKDMVIKARDMLKKDRIEEAKNLFSAFSVWLNSSSR